jgi:hypothetical protein
MVTQEAIDLATSDLRDVAMRNLICGYEKYLETYFPSLGGEVIGDYLVVRNKRDQSIGIFQTSGGSFRVADKASLLDYGGGTPCNVSGLFDEIARLNLEI